MPKNSTANERWLRQVIKNCLFDRLTKSAGVSELGIGNTNTKNRGAGLMVQVNNKAYIVLVTEIV